MVNTRGKIKRTRKTLQLCFPHPSTADSGHKFMPSAALVGSNDDLLTEILIRLPISSVIRFKSVSKRWLSLITHPRFLLLYKHEVSAARGLFLRTLYIPFDTKKPSSPVFQKLDFYPDPFGIRIVQSCNGLFLCCSDRGKEHTRKYYVFNPTTRQFSILPLVPRGRNIRSTLRGMALAFDQTKSPHHYKVVCVHRAKLNKDLFQIEIYSSLTKEWRSSGEPFSAFYFTPFHLAVYWNGAIHWTSDINTSLYFHVDEERLEVMPMPPFCYLGESRGHLQIYCGGIGLSYLVETRGHLHLVETRGDNPLDLVVYEMENDHSGWFVKYRVNLDEFPSRYPEMIRPGSWRFQFGVLGVVRGEKEEDTFMVLEVPGKVIRYNVVEKTLEHIFEFDRIPDVKHHAKFGNSDIHHYVECLAQV